MRTFALILAASAASTLDWSAGAQAATTIAARSAFEPTRFSVVVEGSGPDVILIPGLSSTRDVWSAAAATLKANHRVHLVQIKGFGEPAGPNVSGPVLAPFVEELAQYIRATGIRKPAIVGHSMGGLAALMLGADSPDLAGKILVVDAFPFIGPVFGAKDVAEITPRAEQMRSMLLANADKVKPDFAAKADCAPSSSQPAALMGNMTNSVFGQCMMKHGATASDLRVVAQAMYDDMVTDMRPRLKDITVPVTVFYAQDDRLIGATDAAKPYGDAYAGGRKLKLVPATGSFHFVMQDQPEWFVAELRRFLRPEPTRP